MKRSQDTWKMRVRAAIGKLSPKFLSKVLYIREFGRFPNIKHPKNLNEWILWDMFYGNTSDWEILADKYRVREYLEKKGFGDLLVPLIGKWDDVDDIDFNLLQPPYVLKLNNGCGENIFIKHPLDDYTEVKMALRRMMSQPFGYVTAEPHYLRITPCVIAEKMLSPENQVIASSSLIDYKVFCIDGAPQMIMIIYNRGEKKAQYQLKDKNWNNLNHWFRESQYGSLGTEDIPMPKSLDKMLECASLLSNGRPQLRVDFYEVGGALYIGELTMTWAGGRIINLTKEALDILGKRVSDSVLPKK